MKKLILPLIAFMVSGFVLTGCRMAPSNNPGDTVAASVFYPPDTAALNRKARAAAKTMPQKDSTDIFYIGEGSDRRQLCLVSYPSHRDTIVYGRARHMRVRGNADIGHVVRVSLYISGRGDTLIQRVEEILPEELAAEKAVEQALGGE